MNDHDDDFDRMARSAGAALRRPAPEDGLVRVQTIRKRRQTVRATLVGAGALVILVAGVYVAKGGRADDAGTPTTPASTTTLAPVAAQQPLAFATAADGYALAGQSVRPAGGEATRGAVFVKRDANGAITERVVVYLRADIYRGEPGLGIPIPANLAPAEGSASTIYTAQRAVRVEYGLGDRGHLILEAHHEDQATYGVLTDQMQALAAHLSIVTGQQLAASGALPEGWSLATTGPPPEEVVPSYYQAFEVNQTDGGNKIIVDNRFLDDAGFPYWVEFQTLQPVTVRSHSGFVTFENEYGPDGTTAQPTNKSSMLIWQEAPGQWVTLWAGDMTTAQALALADQLVPVPVAAWGPDGGAIPTTTTMEPIPTT